MPVRVTAYTYPWDLERLGVERTLREMVAHGIEAIDLAATYHPIDALSPRGASARLFTSARGAVHFPARTARYGRIRPLMSAPEVCAVWSEVADRASSLGLGVNAWTVVLYQPWLVDTYPDCARVLPSGDPVGSGACAANDDVRDYVVALCQDIVDQFGVDMIRLEGIAAAGYDYGWLRPRVLVEVSPLARELLALCFCASCLRRAAAAGLDAERVRRLVNDVIATELRDGSATTASLVADPELRAFVVLHERASIALARAVAAGFGVSSAPRLSTMPWTPYSLLVGAARNELLEELVGVVDQIVVLRAWDAERIRHLAEVVSRSPRSLELARLLTTGRPGAALLPSGGPAGSGKTVDEIAGELRRAVALGVKEVNLYNYGLLRDRDVDDLVSAVRAAFV